MGCNICKGKKHIVLFNQSLTPFDLVKRGWLSKATQSRCFCLVLAQIHIALWTLIRKRDKYNALKGKYGSLTLPKL